MEHATRCTLCGWTQSWTTEPAAQAAGVWHVFVEHAETWYAVLKANGEEFRMPREPPPETLGERYEAWESQL